MSSKMTLKPGILVSLSVRTQGGVRYEHGERTKDENPEGTTVEKWDTTRVVEDQKEFDDASKVRGKCRSLIASVCTHSAFGLLCPASSEKDLDLAYKEAKKRADAFNEEAQTVKVTVFMMKGTIAETDQEAAAGIANELKGLLADMREGIVAADVKRVRDAATAAKQMGRMLDEATAKKVAAAVEEARAVAKEITRRLDDEADTVATYVSEVKLFNLTEQRFAFLDTDEMGETPKVSAPVVEFEESQGTLPGLAENDNEPDMSAAPPREPRALEV